MQQSHISVAIVINNRLRDPIQSVRRVRKSASRIVADSTVNFGQHCGLFSAANYVQKVADNSSVSLAKYASIIASRNRNRPFRAAHLSENLRSALRKCVSTSLRSTSLHSRFYSLFSEEDDNMSGIISSPNGIDVAAMRKPYKEGHESFEEGDLVAKKPMAQFAAWFKDATELKSVGEPNAMTVATATKEGRPSARILLMKGYDEKGFKFFTNYESRKGQELSENPFVALCWYWEPLSRSVRVEGRVERLSEQESTEYFHSRPPASQIGAVVSNQSRVIENRAVLTSKDEALKEKYLNTGVTIPKPNYWGGFRVIPEVVEFWQGQSNRLHDRIVFRRPKQDEVIDNKLVYQGEDGWVYERLSP